MVKRLLLLALLFATPLVAQSTVFVAQTAGTFSGGSTGPLGCNGKTAITPASISWSAGTTYVICGTLTFAAGATGLTIGASGTAGSPIIILFDTGASLQSPQFGGQAITAAGGSQIPGGGILSQQNYYIIDCAGGTIQNTDNGPGHTYNNSSVGIYSSGDYHIVRNCVIQNIQMHDLGPTVDAGGAGNVDMYDQSTNFSVVCNNVFNNAMIGAKVSYGSSNATPATSLHGCTSNSFASPALEFAYNSFDDHGWMAYFNGTGAPLIYGNKWTGPQWWIGHAGNLTYINGQMYHLDGFFITGTSASSFFPQFFWNYATGDTSNSPTTTFIYSSDSGSADGGGASANIYGNIIHQTGGPGLPYATNSCGNCSALTFNNTQPNPKGPYKVYNNTFVGGTFPLSAYTNIMTNTNSVPIDVRNNVMWLNGFNQNSNACVQCAYFYGNAGWSSTGFPSVATFDGNDYFGGRSFGAFDMFSPVTNFATFKSDCVAGGSTLCDPTSITTDPLLAGEVGFTVNGPTYVGFTQTYPPTSAGGGGTVNTTAYNGFATATISSDGSAFYETSTSPTRSLGNNLTSQCAALVGLCTSPPQYLGYMTPPWTAAQRCGTGCVSRPTTGAWDAGAYQFAPNTLSTPILCPNANQTGDAANCVQPPVLAFGNQGTNTTSGAIAVSVNNCTSTYSVAGCTGSGSLTLGSTYAAITGANASDFAISGGSCANNGTIPAGSSCTIQITFTPGSAGARSATLTVNYSGIASQTMSLTGTGATVTTISTCQALSGSTNYQLTANVSATGSCFTVGASNVDLNLNGFTVTYCTSSSSSLVGGVILNAFGVNSTSVHGGTITHGAGSCTGQTPTNTYGSGPIIASSDGQTSTSAGTSAFNLTLDCIEPHCKIIFEENGGSTTALGTTVHDVNFTDNDTSSCNAVGCRSADQHYPIVVDQATHAGASNLYNIYGTGGPSGGLVTNAANSTINNNSVSPGNTTATSSNGYAYQDWGTGMTMKGNLTIGASLGGGCISCRGIQVSSVASGGVTGSLVQGNNLTVYNLNNDAEYSGCQIDGAYGVQINDAGSTSDLSGNTIQNNNITAVSGVCPAQGFSWSSSQTISHGANVTRNNSFICKFATGYTTGPCNGFRLSGFQYSTSAPDNGVVSYGDTITGDTADVWIYYSGTPAWTCNQCTFGKGAGSGWVFFSNDGGVSSGGSSHLLTFVDPTFTGGATESSNDLSAWATNNASYSSAYLIQFTQTVYVKGANNGKYILGATVQYTDATSGTYSCTTDSTGGCSVAVNENKYGATTGTYAVVHYNNYSRVVSASGCTTNSASGLNITSLNTQTVTLAGCSGTIGGGGSWTPTKNGRDYTNGGQNGRGYTNSPNGRQYP